MYVTPYEIAGIIAKQVTTLPFPWAEVKVFASDIEWRITITTKVGLFPFCVRYELNKAKMMGAARGNSSLDIAQQILHMYYGELSEQLRDG